METFSSQPRSDRLWDSRSLLKMGYRLLSPRGKVAGAWRWL